MHPEAKTKVGAWAPMHWRQLLGAKGVSRPTEIGTSRMWAYANVMAASQIYSAPSVECCWSIAKITKARRETRWNLLGCSKLANRSQPLVGRSSPYCEDMWMRCYCLTSSFTFCVCRRRRKMYCGHARLCVCMCICLVCLSVRGRTPTLLHGPGCNLAAW